MTIKRNISEVSNSYNNSTIQEILKKKKYSFDPMSLLEDKHDGAVDQDLDHLLSDLLRNQDKTVYSKNNHIYFNTEVDKNSIEKLIAILEDKNTEYEKLKLNKLIKTMEPMPIYLHITSYGGDLLMCFKAIDCIKRSQIPVYTIVEGYAASAGSMMAVAGKKKYMTAHSTILMHQLSSGVIGKFAEMVDEVESCSMFMDNIVKLYFDNSKMSRKTIEKQLKHDSWWSSEKCLQEGLVDSLWTGH
jgi:ATP-dependent Clp protease protease subunit